MSTQAAAQRLRFRLSVRQISAQVGVPALSVAFSVLVSECPVNCCACINETLCTACATGFCLSAAACIGNACHSVPQNDFCSECDPTCHSCVGSGPDACSSCTGDLFLSGSACVVNASCPAATFPQIGPPNTCSGLTRVWFVFSSLHMCSVSCPLFFLPQFWRLHWMSTGLVLGVVSLSRL